MNNKNPHAPKSLVHLTLNTGDRRDSPRTEVATKTLDALGFLFTQQTAHPTLVPWDIRMRVEVERQFGAFELSKEGIPIVSCIVAFGADDATPWKKAVDAYRRDKNAPRTRGDKLPPKPVSVPWLSVHLHAGMSQRPMSEIRMLCDFERCLAWAIIEQYGHTIGAL